MLKKQKKHCWHVHDKCQRIRCFAVFEQHVQVITRWTSLFDVVGFVSKASPFHWTMLHSNLQFDSSGLFFPFLFSLNFRFLEFQTTLQFEFLYRFDSYCFDYYSFNLKWFIDFELFFNFIFLCFFFFWSPFFCFYLFYFRHFLELIFF